MSGVSESSFLRGGFLTAASAEDPTFIFSAAVIGLAATEAAVRLANTILSSGKTLASMLESAGFSVNASLITPSRPAIALKASVNTNLKDATLLEAAAAEQAAALASGSHTAAMNKVFPGAVVVADGAPFVPKARGNTTEFVPATYVQTCSAIGLSCFPGVQCVLPSIVGAANGEPIQCGACPSGYTGAPVRLPASCRLPPTGDRRE